MSQSRTEVVLVQLLLLLVVLLVVLLPVVVLELVSTSSHDGQNDADDPQVHTKKYTAQIKLVGNV
jgi:hypothetical protein